jgi:hypothetical protein
LKKRLCEAVLSSGGQSGNARRFGVKDRRPDADQRDGDQDRDKTGGGGEQQKSGECESHADGERIRLRVRVGIDADQGLEERGGDLKGCGDHPDLAEIEVVGGLEDRINGGDDGLHHVVEEMAEGDGGEDAESGGFGRAGDGEGGGGHYF